MTPLDVHGWITRSRMELELTPDVDRQRAYECLAREAGYMVRQGLVSEPDAVAALAYWAQEFRLDHEPALSRFEQGKTELPPEMERLPEHKPTDDRKSRYPRDDHEEPEPWPVPVETARVLAELEALFQRYLILPRGGALALSVWVLHTWTAHDAAEYSPRLNITSATMRCGKTHVLKVLRGVSCRPLKADGLTAAVAFRLIEMRRPTVLLDEADTMGDETWQAMRQVLNAGYELGGCVYRCVGEAHEPRPFNVFGPFAIARIGKLPATVEDRGISLRMKRKKPGERVEKLRQKTFRREVEPLRRKLARWSMNSITALTGAVPEIPTGLDDRAADLWEPLFAIADLAGGKWPERIRGAALTLIRERAGDAEESNVGVLALGELRDLFDFLRTDRISSARVVENLVRMEERPWQEWGRARKPLTQHGLAKLLKPFRISPQSVRLPSGKTKKGYRRDKCEDAFARWLPLPPVPDRNKVTSPEDGRGEPTSNRDGSESVTDCDAAQTPANGVCDGVTVVTGGVPVSAEDAPGACPDCGETDRWRGCHVHGCPECWHLCPDAGCRAQR